MSGAAVTGGGFDTVFASMSYKLSDFLEALFLVGPTAIVGIGNDQINVEYVREQQEHHTVWLGASDNAAATSLLDPVVADPASVLTGIRNAEVLIAAHP